MMGPLKILCVVGVVELALASLVATAQEKPIVAVFNLEARDVKLPPNKINNLTDYLCSLLAEKGFQVVPREKLRERLAEKKKESYNKCFNQACQIEIGQELAAQKSLSTQVLSLGGKCKVTLTLYDLKRSASEKGTAVSGGCDEAQIVESLEKAVADMLGVETSSGKPPKETTGTGTKPPDLGEYEKLAATAAAEEVKQKEAQKKALEERRQYQTSLEKAWEAVKKIAATEVMGQQARAGVVRKFLQDFQKDNPHEAEARGCIASLDQGKEPFGMQPGNREGMVKIPAGEFVMGCAGCYSSEKPAHKVWVSEFWMDKTEVTQAAYRKCVEAGKCTAAHIDDKTCFVMISSQAMALGKLPGSFQGDNQPVVCVDWNQAMGYCEWVGKRLPTEAEWEKAARGGTTKSTYGDPDQVAWYTVNTTSTTHRVGKKQPNAFGLFDMLGNVWEWCSDWYAEDYYEDSPERDPRGPESGKSRAFRGGSWMSDSQTLRVSFRVNGSVASSYDHVGFRCVDSAAIEK